jgi:hypothetical protein
MFPYDGRIGRAGAVQERGGRMRSSFERGRIVAAAGVVAIAAGLASGVGDAPTQTGKIGSPDGSTASYFPSSVAYSGETVVVGARMADSGSGAAYVYVRTPETWALQAKLSAQDGQSAAGFGAAVALDGDTAVVGRAADMIPAPPGGFTGAAFVYTRTDGTWLQEATLADPDPSVGGYYGTATALSGDTVLVSAPGMQSLPSSPWTTGAAHVFVRTGTTWAWQATLRPDDSAFGDLFGLSLALDGDTAVVGAVGADGGHGAAYVFTRSGSMWTQQAKLTVSGGTFVDRLGATVAVSGDTSLVGDLATWGSTVHVFSRMGTTWTQQVDLLPGDSSVGYFGTSIALRGDTAVVGMPYGQGAAYVFRRSGAIWRQRAKVTTADEMPVENRFNPNGDSFGSGVAAADETRVLIAAPSAAAVYAFDLPAGPAPPAGHCLVATAKAKFDSVHPERSVIVVSGTLDTGAVAANFRGPATFDVGGLHFDVPEFADEGDSLAFRADGLALTITPSKADSSRATFRAKAVGDFTGKIERDGLLTLRYADLVHDLNGTVRLARGALAPRGVVAPDLAVLEANVEFAPDTSERSARMTLQFATDGVVPPVAEDLTISIGGSFAAALRGGWVKRGGAWVHRGSAPGITKAVVDYVKGTITIVGSRLGLSGINGPLIVTVTRGSDVRSVTIRASRSPRKISY